MASENIFLVYALVMGVFITFIYDILRIFRRVFPHGWFLVSLEDICFWIYCAMEVFLLMYHESNGTLRWFAVLGALVGMVCYKKLISSLFVKYTSLLLCRIIKILGKIISFLFKPFRAAARKIGKSTHRAAGKTTGGIRRIKRLLKKKIRFFIKVLKMTM